MSQQPRNRFPRPAAAIRALAGAVLLATVVGSTSAFSGIPLQAGPHDIWYSASQQLLSPEEAARKAQSEHGGKVLGVELREPNDKPPFYRVKLMKKGKVRIMRVRATR